MTRGTPLLVVSATKAEARYVPTTVPLLITGIGKVAAATAVAASLASMGELPPDFEVVNIGTAGALRDEVSGLHQPGLVINHDLSSDVLRGLGVEVHDEIPLNDGDADVVLATGDTFVADPVVRQALALRAALVDMEGFAVAWAATRAGARVRLVKHISDSADSAAVSWPEVVDHCAGVLGEWLRDYLS